MKSVLNFLLLIVASVSLCAQCKVDTKRGAIVMLDKNGKLLLQYKLLNVGNLLSLGVDCRNYSSNEIKMKDDFKNQKSLGKKIIPERFQYSCILNLYYIFYLFFY